MKPPCQLPVFLVGGDKRAKWNRTGVGKQLGDLKQRHAWIVMRSCQCFTSATLRMFSSLSSGEKPRFLFNPVLGYENFQVGFRGGTSRTQPDVVSIKAISCNAPRHQKLFKMLSFVILDISIYYALFNIFFFRLLGKKSNLGMRLIT